MLLRPCGLSTCPATAEIGREYCTVHRIEKVMERVKAVVSNNFEPAIAGWAMPDRDGLKKLRDDILFDLANTV